MKSQFFTVMVCFLMCTLGVNAQKKQTAGVNFEKNYAEALAKVGKSKQKQGLVFVYCYQEGNSACAKMGNLVLKSRQVGDFINQHFVSTRIDVGQAENEGFVKRYPVSVLPAFFVLDKTGEEIGRFCGPADPEVFLEKLHYAMDPANSVKAKLKAFNQDKTTARGRECMEAYYRAGRIKEMVEFVESIYYAYPPEERYSVEMWKYVEPALMDITSPVLASFLADKYMANQYLGKSVVDEALAKSFRQYAFLYVSGKLKDKPQDALSLIGRLALIDDQNLASHYIYIASRLYAEKGITHDKAYTYILNYLSAEKVCALEAEDREFVEHFLMNIEGMPQQLIERYQKDREAYFKKQLEQGVSK